METFKFDIGDKIRVSKKYHWAQGAYGTIAKPPDFVWQLTEGEASWKGWHRFVQGRKGKIEFYWVNFDEPQFDADGDGPYKGGEIKAEMIERLS